MHIATRSDYYRNRNAALGGPTSTPPGTIEEFDVEPANDDHDALALDIEEMEAIRVRVMGQGGTVRDVWAAIQAAKAGRS